MTNEECENYFNEHPSLMVIPFDKYANRSKDVLLINPLPHDKRFELVQANYDLLSQSRVVIPPSIGKYTGRKELFGQRDY